MHHIRTRTFEWRDETLKHNEGWLPVGAPPSFYPGSPFVTAHDVVEHLSDKGDWAHELRAAGVSLFHRDPYTIAGDIGRFGARDHNFNVPNAPARWSKPLPYRHELRIQAFRELLHSRVVRATQIAMLDQSIEVPPEARAGYLTFADRVLPWVRLGYRGAMRVYGQWNGKEVEAMMENLCKGLIDNYDANTPSEGDRLTVTMDPKALTYRIARHAEYATDPDWKRPAAEELSMFKLYHV